MSTKTAKEIIASLPEDVNRVQVIDEFGKQRYRKLDEIADKDQLVLRPDGAPVTMSKVPGRPRKAPPPDLEPTNEAVADMLKVRDSKIKGDKLKHIVETNPESSMVLDLVLSSLAEEAASLGFERHRLESAGQFTSQVSLRRIGALKAIGDAWLKRKDQIASQGVDMESPAFGRLFKFIMETFKEALVEAGERPEMIETVFAKFSKKLDDDWQRDAIKKMTEV